MKNEPAPTLALLFANLVDPLKYERVPFNIAIAPPKNAELKVKFV